RPAPVVVADLRVAQEEGENEPGMAAALPDPAVDDHVVGGLESLLLLVNGAQLLGGLEGPVGAVDRPAPRNAGRSRNVPASQRSLIGIVLHVEALAGVFVRTPHVDQRTAPLHVLQDLISENAD